MPLVQDTRNDSQVIGQRRIMLDLVESCVNLPPPYNAKHTWVKGENAMNGLSNQLFGIYSYVPVALLWNVSLIVGDVYSRDSFQNAMAKYEGWNSLPFSSFFDFDHFQTTWIKRGVAVLELRQFEKACGFEKYQHLTVTREPAFWPNKDLVINQMLEQSEISLPIPDHTVLQFDALRPKFTAMYNYWKGGMRNKLLLLHVHRSLRPAKPIRQVVSAVLRELPNAFFVAHIRLEGKRVCLSFYFENFCCSSSIVVNVSVFLKLSFV